MKALYVIVVIVLLNQIHQSMHSKASDKNKNRFKAGARLNIANVKNAIEFMAYENNCTIQYVKDYGGRVLRDRHTGGHKIQTDALLKVEANDTKLDTRCSFEFGHTFFPKDTGDTTIPPTTRIFDQFDHNFTLTSYFCDEIDGLLLTYP